MFGFDTRSTAMVNISFIGSSTCEFLLAPHFAAYFMQKIQTLDPTKIRLLKDFDAAKAADPKASDDLKAKLNASFVRRLHAIITRKGVLPSVQNFYLDVLTKHGLPHPETVPDATDAAPQNPDEIPLDDAMETDEPAPAPTAEPTVETLPQDQDMPSSSVDAVEATDDINGSDVVLGQHME